MCKTDGEEMEGEHGGNDSGIIPDARCCACWGMQFVGGFKKVKR
jgi:hypothetical protein